MANGVEQITSDTITKEWKPQAMPRLQDHTLDQPRKIGDASCIGHVFLCVWSILLLILIHILELAGQYTAECIFNCRVMIAKHLEHRRTLYHNFIDFKKDDSTEFVMMHNL